MRLAIALACIALAGCDKKSPEPGGFGPWTFSKSTRKNVKTGRCDPHTAEDGRAMTWCYGGSAYQIGARPAELDLYFLGTNDDAPLVEIQLKIRGCHELELDAFMRKTYGAPVEQSGPVTYYQNSFLWAASVIPSAPGRCLVHLLPLREEAEIGRIKQKLAAKMTGSGSAPAPPAGSGSN